MGLGKLGESAALNLRKLFVDVEKKETPAPEKQPVAVNV